MSRIDDPVWVREQYTSEDNLAARKSVYANIEGPDTPDLVFQAVAECEPRRVLEGGGGEGELAARIVRELDAELVGVDQSERMVEIQRSKGIDARVGDVEDLPFDDGEFDTAVAAWIAVPRSRSRAGVVGARARPPTRRTAGRGDERR